MEIYQPKYDAPPKEPQRTGLVLSSQDAKTILDLSNNTRSPVNQREISDGLKRFRFHRLDGKRNSGTWLRSNQAKGGDGGGGDDSGGDDPRGFNGVMTNDLHCIWQVPIAGATVGGAIYFMSRQKRKR